MISRKSRWSKVVPGGVNGFQEVPGFPSEITLGSGNLFISNACWLKLCVNHGRSYQRSEKVAKRELTAQKNKTISYTYRSNKLLHVWLKLFLVLVGVEANVIANLAPQLL